MQIREERVENRHTLVVMILEIIVMIELVVKLDYVSVTGVAIEGVPRAVEAQD